MKRLLLFLALVGLLITGFGLRLDCGETETEDTVLQKEIIAVIDDQKAAWNRADVESFVKAYWHSPEVTFAGSSGITRGWEPVLERYRQRYPNPEAMGKLDFTGLEVHPLGRDSAFVLGRWHLERRSEELDGVFTLVFRHLPEGWRIVHDHTSLDAKTP